MTILTKIDAPQHRSMQIEMPLRKIDAPQHRSMQIEMPLRLRGAFRMSGAVTHDQADVRTMMMGGALLHDGQLFESDEDYLEHSGLNLIASDVTLSENLRLKLANQAMGLDLFNLDQSDKFDWAIFCNWLVTRDGSSEALSDATHESLRTFQRDSFTETFSRADAKGFTVVNFNDAPRSFDRLKKLALENNRGISLKGAEYSFQSFGKTFRAQNYTFQRP